MIERFGGSARLYSAQTAPGGVHEDHPTDYDRPNTGPQLAAADRNHHRAICRIVGGGSGRAGLGLEPLSGPAMRRLTKHY